LLLVVMMLDWYGSAGVVECGEWEMVEVWLASALGFVEG
jgi:hypothetical protein